MSVFTSCFKNRFVRQDIKRVLADTVNGWYRAFTWPELRFKGCYTAPPKHYTSAIKELAERVYFSADDKSKLLKAVQFWLDNRIDTDDSARTLAEKLWKHVQPTKEARAQRELPKEFADAVALVKKCAHLHHEAWAKGYISRRSEGYVERYSGKFGKGFTIHRPSWQTTNYHNIEYWIFNK